jgi:hypothetical protein
VSSEQVLNISFTLLLKKGTTAFFMLAQSDIFVTVNVTLRLTVYRQSVCLDVKLFENHDQIFLSTELLL